MLDYSALAALAAVIREGSFERAARALHVTPSAISQRIRQLEERVGCALVVRGQPCLPTQTGRRLCQHMDRVRLLEQDLHDTLPALSVDGAARVTIPVAVNADSLATWLGPVLARFGAAHPVLLEVTVDDQDHTGAWLRSGAVLAAVTSAGTPASGCDSQPLGAMRYVAAASPQFVARHFAQGVDARALAQAPSLVFNSKDELQARWVEQQCGRHVELARHSLPSPHAFITAGLAGMGWGMHAYTLAAPHLDAGTLVELMPDSDQYVALHWHTARAASRLLAELSRDILSAASLALAQA